MIALLAYPRPNPYVTKRIYSAITEVGRSAQLVTTLDRISYYQESQGLMGREHYVGGTMSELLAEVKAHEEGRSVDARVAGTGPGPQTPGPWDQSLGGVSELTKEQWRKEFAVKEPNFNGAESAELIQEHIKFAVSIQDSYELNGVRQGRETLGNGDQHTSSGEKIAILQKILIAHHYHDVRPTGAYDEATATAIADVQQQARISGERGFVGSATLQALDRRGDQRQVDQLEYLRLHRLGLSLGVSGPAVVEARTMINKLIRRDHLGIPPLPEGSQTFDENMAQTVEALQRHYKMSVTGEISVPELQELISRGSRAFQIADDLSRGKAVEVVLSEIGRGLRKIASKQQHDELPPQTDAQLSIHVFDKIRANDNRYFIRSGSVGPAVSELQADLIKWIESRGENPRTYGLRATGNFDQATADVLSMFQATQKLDMDGDNQPEWALSQDGIVGPRTMRALDIALGRTVSSIEEFKLTIYYRPDEAIDRTASWSPADINSVISQFRGNLSAINLIYASLANPETGPLIDKNGQAYDLQDPRRFIRTKFDALGYGYWAPSSAYGPVQITYSLAEGIDKKYPGLFADDPELTDYVSRYIDQGKKMVRHSKSTSGAGRYEGAFGLGGSGELNNAKDRELYEKMAHRIIAVGFEESGSDLDKFIIWWRGEPDRQYERAFKATYDTLAKASTTPQG